MKRVTICGSFRRHLANIEQARQELISLGVTVLSPRCTNVLADKSGFIVLASDISGDIREVEDSHLIFIKQSDFVWVVCPDSRLGASTSMEIGAATAWGVPVYCATTLYDDSDALATPIPYIQVVVNIAAALKAETK